MPRLTKRKIEQAINTTEKELRLWDDNPRGFGIRIKPSGSSTFFIQYTSPITGKRTRFSIEQYGRLTLDEARSEAKKLFQKIAAQTDPAIDKKNSMAVATQAATLAEFCEDYLRDAREGLVTYRGRPKKENTLIIDEGRIKRHIIPTLGALKVREITKSDIERAMHDIRRGKTATVQRTKLRGKAVVKGGPGTAKRTVSLLGGILSYAIKCGIRQDNPAHGIEREPDGKRDRVLSPDEFRKLGIALEELEKEGANRNTIRAYKVLALTGCRKSEIFALKKSEIDAHNKCLRLADTKTGQQVRAIGSAAIELLAEALKHAEKESEYVFPAVKGDRHMTDVKVFKRAREKADLTDFSLHTLRHSFASVGLELEYSEMTISGLLGHRSHSVTALYAHHVDRSLVAAAERISNEIANRLKAKRKLESEKVVSIANATG